MFYQFGGRCWRGVVTVPAEMRLSVQRRSSVVYNRGLSVQRSPGVVQVAANTRLSVQRRSGVVYIEACLYNVVSVLSR